MTMSNVLAVTDETFAAEVERHAGLVVVDFWATWCGPCRMIKPIVEQLAIDYADSVRFTSLDADANQRTMARFGVRGLPTLLFFQDGEVVDSVVGAVPRARIEDRLRAHLAPAAT
jgi:thioredoxin 1